MARALRPGKRQFSPVSVLKLLSHGKVDLKVKFHVSGQGAMNHISLLHSLLLAVIVNLFTGLKLLR
jgi:hypothetical protein